MFSFFDLSEIAIMRIDVEGMELEVIQGLRETIDRCMPFIIYEILPIRDDKTEVEKFRKNRIKKLETILEEEDYLISGLHDDGNVVELNQLETQSDLSLCDYLFFQKMKSVRHLIFCKLSQNKVFKMKGLRNQFQDKKNDSR